MNNIKSTHIEIAIAKHYGWRQNIIVPNVSWGFSCHECDMLIINKSGYAIEIEIKTTKYDLLKDKQKKHNHNDDRIRELYFAVPSKLRDIALQNIPERAGLFVISNHHSEYDSQLYIYDAQIVRNAIKNKYTKPLTIDEINLITRLGCMRIWNLKNKLIQKQ